MCWTYRKKRGWDSKVPNKSKAFKILSKMRDRGKLDVIQIQHGRMFALGSPEGPKTHGVSSKEYTSRPGNFLLTNGGFFQHKSSLPNKYAAVGESSTTDLIMPLSELYTEYYELIRGDEGTYLHSGPGLMHDIFMKGDRWKYDDETKPITGSLSHGINPNEHLALGVAKNGDTFVFVYTSNERSDGLNFKGWRDMMLYWLDKWYEMKTTDLKQLVNLDGGTSINVVWKANGKRAKKIAQGGIGDSAPGKYSSHTDAIKVANLLVFSTAGGDEMVAESGADTEEEDEDEDEDDDDDDNP